jgi:hypothetical protein
MGPGNRPAVWVCTGKCVRFSSIPVQQLGPLHSDRPNLHPDLLTRGFCCAELDLLVPISSFSFQIVYLWSHSDILLLITKYWHWYIVVLCCYIGHLYIQKQVRHTPCPILNMTVNSESKIFGLASWVTWVAIGCRHSYMRYRLHL